MGQSNIQDIPKLFQSNKGGRTTSTFQNSSPKAQPLGDGPSRACWRAHRLQSVPKSVASYSEDKLSEHVVEKPDTPSGQKANLQSSFLGKQIEVVNFPWANFKSLFRKRSLPACEKAACVCNRSWDPRPDALVAVLFLNENQHVSKRKKNAPLIVRNGDGTSMVFWGYPL